MIRTSTSRIVRGGAFRVITEDPFTGIPMAVRLVGDDAPSSVNSWPDASGNGRNATQATSGNQPVRVAGPNGHYAVAFDGTDDFVVVGSSAPLLYNSSTFTVTTAVYFIETTVLHMWLTAGVSMTRGFYFDTTTSPGLVMNIEQPGVHNGVGWNGPLRNAWVVWTLTWDGVNLYNYQNGTLASISSDSGSRVWSNGDNITLGSYGGGQFASRINIADFIVCPVALSTSQRQQVERALGAKYGITVA